MITVEAFSFGPTGLAGMKVVQYGPQEPVMRPATIVDNHPTVVPAPTRSVSGRIAPLLAALPPAPLVSSSSTTRNPVESHPGVRSLLTNPFQPDAKSFEVNLLVY